MPPTSTSVPPSARDEAGAVRGEQRHRRIRWTVAAALAGRGLTILVTLLTIPLTVKYLGAAQYGYWVAILSTTSLMAFADLGLGYGLLNRVAATLDTGGAPEGRRIVSNAFLMLAGVAGVGLVALLAGFRWLPWVRWFPGADAATARECALAVAVLMAAFLGGLPFTTWQRTVGAVQQGFWAPCWDATGSALSLAGLLVVIRFQGGLVALAAAYAAGPFVALLGGWLWFFGWRRSDLRPRRTDWDGTIARSLLAEGGCYLGLQVGGLLLVSASSLILLQRRGPDELAHYSLTAKLFQFGPQLAALWFAPLWPAYSEALARGDTRWAQRTLRTVTWACLAAGALGGVLLVPSVTTLVRWWTGTTVEADLSLRVALAVMTVLGVATTSVSTFLNASGWLAGQVKLIAVQVPASLALAWGLSATWGAAGLVWAQVAGFALLVVPVYAVAVPRVLAAQREKQRGPA